MNDTRTTRHQMHPVRGCQTRGARLRSEAPFRDTARSWHPHEKFVYSIHHEAMSAPSTPSREEKRANPVSRFVTAAVIVASAFLALGCPMNSNLPHDATLDPNGRDAIFVLGSDPPHVRVGIQEGTLSDGTFSDGPMVIDAFPQNGYVVGRVRDSEGKLYGVVHLRDEASISWSCGATFTFTIKPGEVKYVGHLANARSSSTYVFDADAARGFIDFFYPGLRGRMTVGGHALTRSALQCR